MSLKTIVRYKQFLKEMDEKSMEIMNEAGCVDETTFNLVKDIAGRYYKINPDLIQVHSGKAEIVEVRALFCFIAYLYLDYPIQKIADYIGYSRSTIYHHIETLIDNYLIYKDFEESLDKLLTKTKISRCIKKFAAKKGKYT